MASVLGGLLGYFIGYALYEQVALPLIRFYHYEAAAAAFIASIQRNGVWLILVKGLTPIPFKIVTITPGRRTWRWCLRAGLRGDAGGAVLPGGGVLRRFGEPVLRVVEKRLALVAVGSIAAVVGGFLLLKVSSGGCTPDGTYGCFRIAGLVPATHAAPSRIKPTP